MPWRRRVEREAIVFRSADYDLLVVVALDAVAPPEYHVPDMVAVTFRLRPRRDGGFVYVTSLIVPAALRLGARLGLDEAGSLALVDSHERLHVELQTVGVREDEEERLARHVDAVWLSLRDPAAAELVDSGAFGLVTDVHPGFWETLVDRSGRDP